jgi:hypothetical protein
MPNFIEIRRSNTDASHSPELDEIAREGARRMLAQALEAGFIDGTQAERRSAA